MGFIKKILDTRKGTAGFLVIASALCGIIVGLPFALIAGKGFWGIFKSIYFLFCAPLAVCSLFLVLTKLEDYIYGFSCGLYYGTIFIAYFMKKWGWGVPTEARYAIGLIISSLVCYIVYLRTKHD